MTISSTNRKDGPYFGNDVSVAFPFSFKVFSASDVLVVHADPLGAETILTLTTDYTIALNANQDANPGGTVTLPNPLAIGYLLTISSSLQYLQPTDLTNNGGFYPKVINNALDRLTIFIQQLAEAVSRSLKTAISTPSGVDPQLPAPVPYALIGWNADGSGFRNADVAYSTALATDLASTATNKGASMVGATDSASGSLWTTVQGFINKVISSAGSAVVGFINEFTGSVSRFVQEKLRENYSVLDAGAPRDGTTSARAAINTVCTNLTSAYGDHSLLMVRGEYLIDSDLTIGANTKLVFQKGAKLKISTGVTVTFSGTEISAGRHKIFNCVGTGKVDGYIANDLIYPEWWGAIADGLHPPVATDFSARAAAALRNGPALVAAMTFAGCRYAIDGNAGTVSLTYSYYLTDRTIAIPLSTNLIGYGIGSAIFYYSATGNAVEMISTNNSLVSDIFIAPIAGPTWNFTSGHGLHIDGVSTPIVRNVWCSGFGSGDFYIKSVIEGRIYGLISDNSNGGAFDISGVGQGTILENCVTAGSKGGPCFNIHDGYDYTLIGCTAKDAATGTHGFYLNAVENINMLACEAFDINRDGFQLTATALNCTLTNCTANNPSTETANTYYGFNVSGTRNKLIAPKVTANTPNYAYGIVLGGGATDCSVEHHNVTKGNTGEILDAQPTGSNNYAIRKQTTTDATVTTVWQKFINNSAGLFLKATVVAKGRGSAGATACYELWAYARTNATDTAFMSGPTKTITYESNVALEANFVMTTATANSGVVSLQITGLAATTIDWEATVTVISVTG